MPGDAPGAPPGEELVLRHYWHVYVGAPGTAWQDAVDDHLEALKNGTEHITECVVGIVGPEHRRILAAERIDSAFDKLHLRAIKFYEDEGFEQQTIMRLRAWVHGHNKDIPVLYTHTKGANDSSEINVAWRRSMEWHLVTGLGYALDKLKDVDAVGCHWLTRADWPTKVKSPFFGGNYWLARSNYLRTLPEVSHRTRHDAESWIGLNRPKVHDLLPGWPSLSLFNPEESDAASVA